MRTDTWNVVAIAAELLLLSQAASCFQLRPSQNTHNLRLHSTTADSEPLSVQSTEIVPPQGSFRDTVSGELSVTSLNILAPSYHWLGLDQDEKDTRINDDRENRVPMAIEMAKQSNADILCMQEVEGGPVNEAALEKFLLQPCGDHDGYDTQLWSALHPNRKGDVVGLCVAWRSSKHNLISADCFRRGMVVQMEEIETGATFCIGNVHLPAKPAAILGRLKSISTTIKCMEGCETPRRVCALDGAMIVAGDFNCDQNSVTAKLLETGSSPYGTLKDRNYKAKVTKEAASSLRHSYRFKDIYADGLREKAAPVTVSLSGRGPGCMDHMYYASRVRMQSNGRPAISRIGGQTMGKRRARKQQAIRRVAEANIEQPSPLRIEFVLATIDPDDSVRTETIMKGLPNVSAGFPSDHVPVGALFAPVPNYNKDNTSARNSNEDDEEMNYGFQKGGAGGVSANARRRREAYSRSLIVRRRHNAILREVTEWLVSRGAKEAVRDQPLYKWKWANGVKIGRKLRAPDLCCVIDDKLIIVEVTVAHKPNEMRRQKLEKYKDLAEVLRTAPAVTEAGLEVPEVFVVLMDEDGEIPDATRQDLYQLAAYSGSGASIEAGKVFCNHLQRVFAEYNKNLA